MLVAADDSTRFSHCLLLDQKILGEREEKQRKIELLRLSFTFSSLLFFWPISRQRKVALPVLMKATLPALGWMGHVLAEPRPEQ